MPVKTIKSFLAERLWDFNFIFKLLAWSLNKYCVFAWLGAVEDKVLPAYNEGQLAFFYFAIPAYDVVLTGFVLLYLFDEIPKIMTQRVFIVTGISLFIVTGTVGLINSLSNEFPHRMMVMSLLLVANGLILIFDFIKFENFFSPKHRKDSE